MPQAPPCRQTIRIEAFQDPELRLRREALHGPKRGHENNTNQTSKKRKRAAPPRAHGKFLRCDRKQPRQPEGSRTLSAASLGRFHHRQNSSLTATTLNNERKSGPIARGHKYVVLNVWLLLLFLEEKPTERAANPRVAKRRSASKAVLRVANLNNSRMWGGVNTRLTCLPR